MIWGLGRCLNGENKEVNAKVKDIFKYLNLITKFRCICMIKKKFTLYKITWHQNLGKT
jgi:hypothetical protein